MKTYKIGITDYVKPPYTIEQNAFNKEVEFIQLQLDQKDINPIIEECDALLVWNAKIDKNIIKRLKNCKIIVRYGVGFDAVDINELNQVLIPLCNTPDYGTEEVADTTLALIMSLHRSVYQYDSIAKNNDYSWTKNSYRPIRRSNQTTVGIIGIGRIGTAVINRLKNFGFTIIGYDPYQPSGHEKAIGYQRINNLEELLNKSDIVSIHTPSTGETKEMVDINFFKSMRKGSIFINTARGNILKDLDCLYEALKNDYINSVGLDVLPQEPPRKHPLIEDWKEGKDWIKGRLIINPHSSYYSLDSWEEMRYKAAETINIFLSKGILRNQIK